MFIAIVAVAAELLVATSAVPQRPWLLVLLLAAVYIADHSDGLIEPCSDALIEPR